MLTVQVKRGSNWQTVHAGTLARAAFTVASFYHERDKLPVRILLKDGTIYYGHPSAASEVA
jgi:hypothetical protein